MSKQYSLPFAASVKHVPKHPERTAKRQGASFDVIYQVWTNREALARTIRMQQRRARHFKDWHPVVPLRDGEGY